MTDLYNIVMQGKAVSGRDNQEVKKNLAALFKDPTERMERLLSGKRVIVKKKVSHEQAVKIVRAIKKAGAECKIVKYRKAIPKHLVMEKSNKSGSNSMTENRVVSNRKPDKIHRSQQIPRTDPYKTPSANLFEIKEGINALAEFKKVSTWTVFFLSLVTCGVYNLFWLYSRTNTLNRLASVKPISNGFIISTIIFWCLSILFSIGNGIMSNAADVNVVYSILSGGVSVVATILPIVWCFKFRNRLNAFLTNHVGGGKLLGPVLTFFFQTLYLSYKLNENIEIMEDAHNKRF